MRLCFLLSIHTVRMGELNLLYAGLDMTRVVPLTIDIVLSSTSGRVQGAVSDNRDAPASGTTVALVRANPNRLDLYRAATVDIHGKFEIAGLAPGECSACAWDEVEDNTWTDRAFLVPFQAKARRVTVTPGAAATVDLKLQ